MATREHLEDSDRVDCPDCAGAGALEVDAVDGRNEHTTIAEPCDFCDGDGEVRFARLRELAEETDSHDLWNGAMYDNEPAPRSTPAEYLTPKGA